MLIAHQCFVVVSEGCADVGSATEFPTWAQWGRTAAMMVLQQGESEPGQVPELGQGLLHNTWHCAEAI